MENVKIKYTSVAMPPDGVVVTCEYQLGKDKDGYYIVKASGNEYMDIEMLKVLFTPVDSSWDKVLHNKDIKPALVITSKKEK